MKNFSWKILTITLVSLFPIAVFAQTPSAQELVKQMQALLTQYSERIRVLEAENTMLKGLMAKHEIQIPLEEYDRIMNSAGTKPPAMTTPTVTTANDITHIDALKKWFITQIRKDWEGIRGAYNMPSNAYIGAYEFVKNDAGNNVYVDIVYGNGTAIGAYNAKLLYEFDKTNFKRKLLGLFDFNEATSTYTTRTGKNLFAGVEREIIRENIVPVAIPTASQATPSTPVVNVSSTTSSKIESEILSLYEKKNYAELLKKSDEYLKNNAATYNLYVYRYRAYFVLGQYAKALQEIQNMDSAKMANAKIYCDASVVAQYAKNNALAESYRKLALAQGTCNVKP